MWAMVVLNPFPHTPGATEGCAVPPVHAWSGTWPDFLPPLLGARELRAWPWLQVGVRGWPRSLQVERDSALVPGSSATGWVHSQLGGLDCACEHHPG